MVILVYSEQQEKIYQVEHDVYFYHLGFQKEHYGHHQETNGSYRQG